MSKITIGFICLGCIVGFVKGAGILSLIAIAGFMWIGNSISGLLTGQIQNLLGNRFTPYAGRMISRKEEPFNFYFEMVFELFCGGGALLYFFVKV